VFTINEQPAYLLVPRDSWDMDRLLESLGESKDFDLVIGNSGPQSPPEACNGLALPMVTVDQLYSFDLAELTDSLVKGMEEHRTEKLEPARLKETIEGLFRKITQMADNAGATDQHRALNYLIVRYDRIYSLAAEEHAGGSSLTAVRARQSKAVVGSGAGGRKVMDVILTFTNPKADSSKKYLVRVDVGEFPFLVTRLSEYDEPLTLSR
jgi:hypothetical protein